MKQLQHGDLAGHIIAAISNKKGAELPLSVHRMGKTLGCRKYKQSPRCVVMHGGVYYFRRL